MVITMHRWAMLVSQSGLPFNTSALRRAQTFPPHMVPVELCCNFHSYLLAPTASWIAKPYRCLNFKNRSATTPKAGSETIIAAALASLLGCDVQGCR
ncbi:hypothetical protein ACLB1E_29400 [Escherichia coli]